VKICLLGDTHFGIRNDSKAFHKFYEKFYSEQFFPYLVNNKINLVLQLGDLFDRRKYINFLTLSESKRYFFDPLKELGIELHSLLGNHDIFWKESLEVNSPSLLLEQYDNIFIYKNPYTLFLSGTNIDLIPWLCKENEKEVYDFITNSKSELCAGHFELAGFDMMKGVPNQDGVDKSFLKKYKHVYSGHYHTASSNGNVTYLGVPYEMIWSDYKDPKGFYILDTDSYEIEFIRNNNEMFIKHYYDEKMDSNAIDTSCFEEKIVKLVVINKTDFNLFDKFVERIYNRNPLELKIIEDLSEFESSAVDDNLNLEDTMTLLSDYVDGLETDADKLRLKTLLKELYIEAQDFEQT